MGQAINGVPPLNLRSAPATSSGQVYGSADVDPNSFQLLVNWFMNQNINSLSKVGSGIGDDNSGESSSSPFDSMFGNSTFGASNQLSGGDPFSALGASAMNGISPSLMGMSPYGSMAGLSAQNPILDLQRLQAFTDYSSLVNEDNPTAASYIDPNTGETGTGIIKEVKVDNNAGVSFKINDELIPISYVKSLTKYEEAEAEEG